MKIQHVFVICIGCLLCFSCRKDHQSSHSQGPVQACFRIAKDTFYVGDTVAFANCSTNADTLLYNFGDGSVSPDSNPIHIYAQPGTYTVSLRAANLSLSNTTSKTIVIKAGIPSITPWRYFAPGSSTDSMVFYGTGAGTFIIQGYDLAGGTLPATGYFTSGNSFTFGHSYTYNPYDMNAEIYGNGSFSDHDSTVNLTYSLALPFYNNNTGQDTSFSYSGTFYGVIQ